MSYRARDRLRQADHRPRTFVPTIAVERAVILDKDQRKQYRSGLHEELGRRIGKSFRSRYRVLNPEELRLPVVDPQAIITQVRGNHERPRPSDVARTAYLLKGKLQELLEGTPTTLQLQLGKVAFFDEAHPRKPHRQKEVVGVEPKGWRGPNARYASHGAAEQPSPLGLLVDVSRLCAATIAEGYQGVDPVAITEDPRIRLLEKTTGIPQRDRRDIEVGLQEALSDKFQLSDPFITLRTSQSTVERIDVRPTGIESQIQQVV